MKAIWDIYRKDLQTIISKFMTIVIIGGLAILPSLYAWLNVKASWDPYAKTDQIPIGFVNEDRGAEIQGEEVLVGEDLAEQLEEDDSFDWHFVSHEEGMKGVEYGDFYATIIVPEDFSETLGSVLSSEPEKAEISYYVNEKINAIAPKITDKGASVIVEEISRQFIATVNGIIFEMFNDIGLELEQSLPDIELFESYVYKLEDDLPLIHDKLKNTDKQLSEAKKYVEEANKKMPEANRLIESGKTSIQEAKKFVVKVEDEFQKLSPKLEAEAAKIEKRLGNLSKEKEGLEQVLDEAQKNLDLSATEEKVEGIQEELTSLTKKLKELQEELDDPNEKVDQLIEEITSVEEALEQFVEDFTSVVKLVSEQEDVFKKVETSVKDLAEIDISSLTDTIETNVYSELEEVKAVIDKSEATLTEVEKKLPEVASAIGTIDNKIDEGKEVINTLLIKYPIIYDQVEHLADSIREVQSEADLQKVIELLLNDPEAEKSFFKEPVTLDKNEVFPIENYGTGMTPFYTVLSLWVGGLLLISLVSPKVPGEEKLNPKVVYIGRFLTFLTIGMLQALIVTLGDIFIVKVTISHKFWFVIFGLLISAVFMLIVYTAVSILGDVGKAVAIILLVLQIASSGGTYPVVLLPEFFQTIHPILPFTYGVDLMREAVGGIIWKRVIVNVVALLVFALITLMIGLFLKGPVQNRLEKLTGTKDGRLF